MNSCKEFTYKNTITALFKKLYDMYKRHVNKKKNSKTSNIEKEACLDYYIFVNLQNGIHLLHDIIKYLIWANVLKWKSNVENNINNKILPEIPCINDVLDLKIDIPNNIDELDLIIKVYPYIVENAIPEVLNIITLQTFEKMKKISDVNLLLYFSTFSEEEHLHIIYDCEHDVEELWKNLELLMKKIIDWHVKQVNC